MTLLFRVLRNCNPLRTLAAFKTRQLVAKFRSKTCMLVLGAAPLSLAATEDIEEIMSRIQSQMEQELTPPALLRNSAKNATFAAITMYSQCGLMFTEMLEEYINVLESLVKTLELRVKHPDSEVIWSTIISLRNTAYTRKETVQSQSGIYESCLKSLETIAQTTYDIGSEDVPIFSNQRIELIGSKVSRLRKRIDELESTVSSQEVDIIKQEQ